MLATSPNFAGSSPTLNTIGSRSPFLMITRKSLMYSSTTRRACSERDRSGCASSILVGHGSTPRLHVRYSGGLFVFNSNFLRMKDSNRSAL